MHTVQIFLQSCWRPKKHLLIHSGENPFKCRQCNYFCKQTGDLKKHILTHSGKKAFKCAQCTYSASLASNLRTHMLSHSGEKPFSCTQCICSCLRSFVLKTHSTHYSKLEVVIVASVGDQDFVGNSLMQIWKLRFGHKS